MAQTGLEVVISAKDQFSATANRVTGSLRSMSSAAGQVGKGVGQVGMGLARVGAIAATAAAGGIAAVAKASIDFETAFTGVRKTLDASPEQLDKIARQFRNLATEIPISANELSRIGEIAGQLGIKADDITDFTRVVAELGIAAPQLSTEDAAFGLARILTLTGQTTDKADELASAIVDLGNNFATTEPAIVQIAERFASVANAAGISTQGVLGLATAVTALGGEPQEAGTSLQRSIQRITLAVAEGGKELSLFADTAGLTAKDFRDSWERDALGTFQAFLKGLGEIESNVERTQLLDALGLGDARLGKTILNLATAEEITSGAIKTANTAWKENTALSIEAQKRYDTLASRLTVLKNNVIESALVIGEGFTPAIGRAADKLKAFLQLPSTQRDLKNLGRDVGAFIDGIDFAKVLSGAQTMLSVVKEILSVISKIPPEVTASVAAFVGIDKLSGGLIGKGIGNIASGIAGGVANGIARGFTTAGIGKLFVQPVFVTNPGFGAGGGVGGAAGAVGGAVAGITATGLAVGGGILAVAGGVADWLQKNFIGQADIGKGAFEWPEWAKTSLNKIADASEAWTPEQRDLKNRLHGDITDSDMKQQTRDDQIRSTLQQQNSWLAALYGKTSDTIVNVRVTVPSAAYGSTTSSYYTGGNPETGQFAGKEIPI